MTVINSSEMKTRLKSGGVSFMSITPFEKDGTPDYDGYRENLRFTLDKIKNFESCTMTPIGSNGEATNLSDDESKKITKICIDEVNGQIPVIVGAGKPGTKETIKLSKYAQEMGADGVQIILPYYFIPTEEGMFQHFVKLAESIDIGIVIYNNPAFSGSWIKPTLMKKLIDKIGDKIIGVKENTPHLMLFDSMVKTLKDTGTSIYSGFGEQWYKYQFPWGADGLATPFGNFYPEFPINLYKAAKKYDFEGIRQLMDNMQPYYAFVGKCNAKRPDTGMMSKPGGSIYGEGNVRFGIIKEAMNLMGLRGGYSGLPLMGIDDNEREELKEILKVLNLL